MNRLNGVKFELLGEMSSDGVGVWRVLGRFADVIDRGPVGAGASEDLVQRLCRDLDVLVEVYLKLFIEAVDDKLRRCSSSISLSASGCSTPSQSRHSF